MLNLVTLRTSIRTFLRVGLVLTCCFCLFAAAPNASADRIFVRCQTLSSMQTAWSPHPAKLWQPWKSRASTSVPISFGAITLTF